MTLPNHVVLPLILASMGPPLKAAENVKRAVRSATTAAASMGPPLKAAENAESPMREPGEDWLQWGRR